MFAALLHQLLAAHFPLLSSRFSFAEFQIWLPYIMHCTQRVAVASHRIAVPASAIAALPDCRMPMLHTVNYIFILIYVAFRLNMRHTIRRYMPHKLYRHGLLGHLWVGGWLHRQCLHQPTSALRLKMHALILKW